MRILADAYRYEVSGLSYYLWPTGTKTVHGWRVTNAEMWDAAMNYLGTWQRKHMPLKLIHALENHMKYIELFGEETQEDTANSE
jgi:uncharacterized protein YbdZ (MbtH family)